MSTANTSYLFYSPTLDASGVGINPTAISLQHSPYQTGMTGMTGLPGFSPQLGGIPGFQLNLNSTPMPPMSMGQQTMGVMGGPSNVSNQMSQMSQPMSNPGLSPFSGPLNNTSLYSMDSYNPPEDTVLLDAPMNHNLRDPQFVYSSSLGQPRSYPGYMFASPSLSPILPSMGYPQQMPPEPSWKTQQQVKRQPTTTFKSPARPYIDTVRHQPQPTRQPHSSHTASRSSRENHSHSSHQSHNHSSNHSSNVTSHSAKGNFNLKNMIAQGVVADLATDQNGSRFIQQQLEIASLEDRQAVFNQIFPEAIRLCTDVFGNYVVQKYFEYGTPEQKHNLARALRFNILPLSLQMYGCRVVQKLFGTGVLDDETQAMLISELNGHVLECVKDQNGNHVVQKCIEKVHGKQIEFILEAFRGCVFDLSTHPYGCRVIQRVLEHCPPNQKDVVLNELMSCILQIAKDQYGNYVLQHVLQHTKSHSDIIVQAVASNILTFSKHKFASNVVERCFIAGLDSQREVLLNSVINPNNSPLGAMVRDQYGNYVIQKMLETLNVPQRNKLIRKISEFVPNIRKIAFGKHIVLKIEKITGKTID